MTSRAVIDAHAHVWSQDVLRYPFGPHDGLEAPADARSGSELLADASGTDLRGVLLVQPRVYGYDHAYLFDAAAALPIAARVVPLVNVTRRSGAADVRRLAAHELTAAFRVIALGERPAEWLCSREAGHVWAAAAQLGLPVGLLIDARQLTFVARLAAAHADLTVVVDHMAWCGPRAGREWADLLCELAAQPNVLVKLSAIAALSEAEFPYADMWPLIASLYDAYGASRLLWGSDWPHVRRYGQYGRSYAAIAQALSGASQRNLEAILSATAARIYGFRPVEVAGGTDHGA